ncbi:HTH domain-containing protein [Caldimonas sp. KR1-144]|uniref:HTH domain-containing protein n=1 Tax=Caldimonas sp. KR1-144 TaxID=3400911 RepID=UPI003BFDFE16
MNANQLLNLLSEHQGRNRGIAARDLAVKAGLSPRQVRKRISALRDEGIAICGKPATGYFVPVTPDELEESCEFLEHRALHSLRLLSRMKKVALPELLGQLRLNKA